MRLWDDGRSGEAGCEAGSLVLSHLSKRRKLQFRKLRGTTFETDDAIWIGRVCATDSYLSPGVAHWANISWDQHRDMRSEAAASGRSLIYLFITATNDPPAVHYWTVPGEVLEQVLEKQKKNHRGAVLGLHISIVNGRYKVHGVDVTEHHEVLALQEEEATRLTESFAVAAQKAVRRGSDDEASSVVNDGEQVFHIPLTGGRTANLRLPVPVADSDVQRLKGWFDLMSDLLTAPSRKEG